MTDVDVESGMRRRRAVRFIAGVIAAAGLLALGALGGAVITGRRQGPASATGPTSAASPVRDHTAHSASPSVITSPGLYVRSGAPLRCSSRVPLST